MDELQLHFEHIDSDGDGAIDQREFTDLVARLGLRRGNGVLRLMFEEVDGNGDGRISREEFAAWWVRFREDE